MARKKKEELDTDLIDRVELGIRPEQIVKYYRESGNLPADFNPYGDYDIGQLKFLGDAPPKNTPYYVGVNLDDEDLIPIFISTPQPPKEELITNYGLPKDDQFWRRPEVPITLKKLEERAYLSLYEIEVRNRQEVVQGYRIYQKYWEILEQESDKYRDEIQWIKHIWWWRLNGFWMFNDGELVYLSGDYFDYLAFWYIKESEVYPDFREEDRKNSIFSKYLEETTETFQELHPETGKAIKSEDGTYRMVDVGSRTFFGEMTPKFRRAGETQRGCHKVWKGTSTMQAAYGTIISMEGDNAEKHYYKKLIPAWNKYPMFLKPIWMGSKRPSSLKLIEPPNVWNIEGLGSTIDFTGSAGVGKNDGDTLHFSLMDEEGKDSRASIFERWSVNKMAMSRGGGTNIIGYSLHPSTVEEMDGAGLEYYKLAQLSCFYERMPVVGQTYSGLARIFIPSYKKLEGYIDKWGKSVIEDPTERQMAHSPRAKFALTGKGARETLQSQLDSLLSKGTPEALEAYRSRRRKFPMKWADCWLGSAGNAGFNLEIIDKRLAEINRDRTIHKQPYRTGNLYRENPNDNQSRVLWADSVEGKWELSMILPPELTNQRIRCDYFDPIKMQWLPAWKPVRGDKFTCGLDPFRSIKKADVKDIGRLTGSASNSRQSDGGICVYWEYDKTIDGGKNRLDWQSDRVVCVYRARPASQEEYFDDAIMTLQYFGAMCYPEYNVERVVTYLIEHGMWGYMLYDINTLTGKPNPMPGRYTSTDTWSDAFGLIKDHIEFRGHAECHDKLLNEIKAIRGPESMTHLDLAAAFCMAKFGSQSRHREIISGGNKQPSLDISSIGMFRKRYI
jgi:hypothetical protein